MKVLLIDDNDDILTVAQLALQMSGDMSVKVSNNGPDGVHLAQREQPDVILVDVMMPGMDGPAVLHALRDNPATAQIPVAFLTAKIMPSEIARLLALGACRVLTKPFDPLTLAHEVRALLTEESHGQIATIAG